jgi:hypothetical protein
MKGISINGYYLHKIEMLLESHSEGTVSYLRYPKHRMHFKVEGDKLFLKIPAFLLLELYRRGIIPQDSSKSVSVKISGKNIGKFLVVDFRYPHYEYEVVSMILKREEK